MGKLHTTIIHTPGFTPESSCFVVKCNDKNICLFTGDTIFLGDVGRPEVSLDEQEQNCDKMMDKLFNSLQKLKKLNQNLRLYPGHGNGSLCGRAIHPGNHCTLRNQIQVNYPFSLQSKQQFKKYMGHCSDHIPKYFQHTLKQNEIGIDDSFKDLLKKAQKPLLLQEFRQLNMKQNITVIDSRKQAQSTGIIKGSYWLSSETPLSNWISMIIKPEDPYILVCKRGQESDILERYIRIGYFNCQGFSNFDMFHYPKQQRVYPLLRNYRQFGDTQDKQYVDVRSPSEWNQTGVIQGAKLLDLRRLEQYKKDFQELKQIQKDHLIVVHCKTGMRSRLALSIFMQHGIFPVILVEGIFYKYFLDVDHFKELGLKMISVQKNKQYLKNNKGNKKQKREEHDSKTKKHQQKNKKNTDKEQNRKTQSNKNQKNDHSEESDKSSSEQKPQKQQKQFQSSYNHNMYAASYGIPHDKIQPDNRLNKQNKQNKNMKQAEKKLQHLGKEHKSKTSKNSSTDSSIKTQFSEGELKQMRNDLNIPTDNKYDKQEQKHDRKDLQKTNLNKMSQKGEKKKIIH